MQATATAPVRTARETLFGEKGIGTLQEDVNLNAPRFFVQMGWETLGVDTLAIPNMRLLRGEVTPCRTYAHKANRVEIREGDLIPGMDEEDRDGKTVYGYYRRYAYYEAERLLELERRNERQSGLLEIKALSTELGAEVYKKVDLNLLFFPEWPNLPVKNEEVKALLEERMDELEAAPSSIQPQYREIILNVGRELIAAADLAHAVQKHLLTYTHQCMKLTPKDEAFKRAYDTVDYEMLKRTGIPEIHAAEIQTAQALDKLTDARANADNGLAQVVGVMQQQMAMFQEQMAQQNKLIELLLADRPGNGAVASGRKSQKNNDT